MLDGHYLRARIIQAGSVYRIQRLGGHEGRSGADKRLGSATEQQSDELLKARIKCSTAIAGAPILPMFGTVKKPEWLSIDFIHELFGIEPLQSFRATYRRQLEEMAALGKWEDSWKESVKASASRRKLRRCHCRIRR